MSHGDEWKHGTPYEDPEERAERELREILRTLGQALGKMAEAFGDVHEAMQYGFRPAAEEEAVARLMTLGVDQETAREEARATWTQARAEGRGYATLLKALLHRVTIHGPSSLQPAPDPPESAVDVPPTDESET